MIGPIARILVRYASAAAFTFGFVNREVADQLATDPDIIMVVAAGLAIVTETAYAVAKRKGWAT